ncbi:AMP-binding protein [Actinacidiphila yeochonensis]|uniref:AMP-binding protein n=1 Tax=Actinacidiphila yeochonensis TaxID=89050 RepID=UPI000A43546A|nr:AMP-binding protein [Actinacidiphila yeochonensis]
MSDVEFRLPSPSPAAPAEGPRLLAAAPSRQDVVTGGRHSRPRPRRGRGGGGGGGARTAQGGAGRLLGPRLRLHAERHPQQVPVLPFPGPAAADSEGRSYAELDRRARAVAARLGRTLQPGSRVLLVYPQGADFAGALLDCLYAGMAAVPLVQTGRAPASLDRAVRTCAPAMVLTGTDAWTPLVVDRTRAEVVEADGIRIGGEPVWRLAQQWRPVGVLRGARAYQRYHDDGGADGRLEPAMSHADLGEVLDELAQAVRLGTDEENVGWIAAVHGVENAVWRTLLPIHVSG